MRVILKQDVPNLGSPGDIVNVARGYGRNFLIPRGLAIPASEGSVREAEHQQRVAEAIRRKQLAGSEDLAKRITDTPITIRREAGEDEKLFGSVTNRDIAEALAAEGIELDRRTIQLAEKINAIGVFNVPVRLHRDVTTEVRVFVIRA
jgi:large subunit ribosomal protein L9